MSRPLAAQRPPRLVAVLGYSSGRGSAIHPICRARVEHAATVVDADDVVLLSGWARHASARSEAALMEEAWPGPPRELLLDEGARTTTENARHALRLAAELALDRVVVVTSSWHTRRALSAFRLLAGPGLALAANPVPARAPARSVQEALLLPVTALQVARTRRER